MAIEYEVSGHFTEQQLIRDGRRYTRLAVRIVSENRRALTPQVIIGTRALSEGVSDNRDVLIIMGGWTATRAAFLYGLDIEAQHLHVRAHTLGANL